jgi:hypothetical protein
MVTVRSKFESNREFPFDNADMPFPDKWAQLSECGTYRYALGRRVSAASGRVLFCMLNPSVADSVKSDSTLTRCVGFARSWDIGELVVCNLFAYRSTKPAELWKADDPVGPNNDGAIEAWARTATLIVCAWGNQPKAAARVAQVIPQLRSIGQIHHLGLTNSGSPRHPLYLRRETEPEIWM